MFIYFLREGESELSRGGVRERERETQNQKQAPGSQLSAQSPMQAQTHEDHDLEIMT